MPSRPTPYRAYLNLLAVIKLKKYDIYPKGSEERKTPPIVFFKSKAELLNTLLHKNNVTMTRQGTEFTSQLRPKLETLTPLRTKLSPRHLKTLLSSSIALSTIAFSGLAHASALEDKSARGQFQANQALTAVDDDSFGTVAEGGNIAPKSSIILGDTADNFTLDNFSLDSSSGIAPSLTVAQLSENSTVVSPQDAPLETAPNLSPAVAAEQIEILNPTTESVVDVPAITVIVRFPANADLELRINDTAVSNDLIGRTESNPATNLVTQTWFGIPLDAGKNTLTVVRSSDGSILQSRLVEVRGAPVEMTLRSRDSKIPADGRSTTVLQGRLLDSNGNVSNWDAIVTLNSSDGDFVGVDYAPDQPGFQVEAQNGRFTAELQSSLESHVVQLQATTIGLETFNQVQFSTPQRPSIATGIVDLRLGARGTNFHSSLRDFLPPDEDNGYGVDLDASLFTMGNVGEWLLTSAFNSDRALNEDCRGETSLFRQGAGSCNNLYPVYGDDSTQDITTPSTDRFYLRLERTSQVEGATADYAMWGDYNTEEFANSSQLFTSTSRQLHGFKLNYNLGNLALTGLYGDNIEGFQRDTIAPDGTSGLYFLSRRLVISGSEQVYIETEELDRPGTVLNRERLFRNTDYDIDYDRGTLLFEDPVTQTAVGEFGEVLLRRIVVTYQFEGEDTDTNILAGRLQYNFDRNLSRESWLGTSYLREDQGNREFVLFGADAQVSLGDTSRLIAEIAHSESDFDLSGPISGSAYRVELDGSLSNWFDGRAYWRSTDAGFSNAATTSFVPGQTRYGAQANFKVSRSTTLRAQVDHEDNDGVAPRPITNLEDLLTPGQSPVPGSRVDNSLTTYSLGLAQRLGDSNLEFDWIHRDRTDRTNPGQFNTSSDQLRTRLTSKLANNLTFRAQNELNLSSESDPIYPSRTYFGIDWEAMPGINVGLGQVFYGDNGFSDRDSYTIFDVSGERSLGEDTTLRGRFSSIDGQNLGGAVGIEHGFKLGPGLRLDVGYERVFNSIFGGTAAGSQFTQPFAVGNGGSSVGTINGNTYTVGLSYTDNPDLQASTRLEHRDSSQGSNTVLNASAVGRLTPAVSALFNYQLNRAANQRITNIGTTSNLKMGLAYRDPNDDRLNALLRYEHRINPGTLPTNALFGRSIDTSEHVLSAEALYAPNWQWEIYGKYAFRSSQTRINLPAEAGGNFTSNNNLHLAQMRATYRFDYHWDASAEARWFGGLGDYSELGYSLEVGYYPTPDLRMYGGYSGGGAFDDDFGVNRSAGGFYLGVSAKINSLFNGFGLQNVAPAQQQESVLESEEPVIFIEDTTEIIFPGEAAAQEDAPEEIFLQEVSPDGITGPDMLPENVDVYDPATENGGPDAGIHSIPGETL
ncbi:TonB-dependent receptor [Leptothoe kymatousa]|uniref:TonB-dependent receptor n=1 Tax=Leptothoe kymatousa TAU-MAC 1615 TaxID=2364775 RepID=A0ABS5Y107_9CYAN|nr:TonB-dependent receptor [Leptothoe kymatousa]MBT9311296.1 TonB-dependent receptor [Leptothoe kymatousa TAU-MAC 1615]